MKLLDITGNKFGLLTAITPVEVRPRKWICKCDCGNTKEILQTHLVQGNVVSCGCITRGSGSSCWKGVGEIHGNTWYEIKTRIRNKKLPFTINLEYIWELFLKQNRRCSYTNILLEFGKTVEERGTASLDRIDSNKGYEIGNVQWVHKTVNIMKNRFDDAFFLNMCNKVSIFNGIEPNTSYVDEKWIRHSRLLFMGRDKEVAISKEYALEVYNKQYGSCALSGIPIVLNNKGGDCQLNIASLDRIDNSKGYIHGNVQWVHKSINIMRGKLTVDEFVKWCKLISSVSDTVGWTTNSPH